MSILWICPSPAAATRPPRRARGRHAAPPRHSLLAGLVIAAAWAAAAWLAS